VSTSSTNDINLTLLEVLPDAVLLVSGNGSIVKANALAHALFGYPAGGMIGQSVEELLPTHFRGGHRQHRATYELAPFTRPMGIGRDLVAIRNDGTEFPVEVSLSPLETQEDLVVLTVVRDISERKNTEKALLESREQLRRLTAYLQRAREEERTLVAREIHDELGQALTALKMDLVNIEEIAAGSMQTLNFPAMADRLASMSQLIDATVQAVRKISAQLRPVLLDSLGLIPAIEWQLEELQNRTNIRCVLTVSPEEFEVDRDRSTAVFRILQEALTNTVRHAKAAEVDVRLTLDGCTLFLEVRDDGRGISVSDTVKAGSFGLLGMRERAFMFGGELTISGLPGKGTTVSLKMPVAEAQTRA
jgi:two-component system, NarL family, sensor histidine kinase UhpB